jgi:hypothetical protein
MMPLRIKDNAENMLFNFFFLQTAMVYPTFRNYSSSDGYTVVTYVHRANACRPDTIQIKNSQHCQDSIPPLVEEEAPFLNTYIFWKEKKPCPWISR